MAAADARHNREQEIADVAMRLFAEKGYASTSIQDVADKVGVLKGSLYHYIDSKEDLLFKIFYDAHLENEQLIGEIRAIEGTPSDRLHAYLQRSISVALHNIERTILYFRDWRLLTGSRLATLELQRRQYDHFLRELIVDVHAELGLESEVDAKSMSSFIIGATNWMADWYRSGDAKMADRITRYYTHLAMVTVVCGARDQIAGYSVHDS